MTDDTLACIVSLLSTDDIPRQDRGIALLSKAGNSDLLENALAEDPCNDGSDGSEGIDPARMMQGTWLDMAKEAAIWQKRTKWLILWSN
jgi:hypothetical protein